MQKIFKLLLINFLALLLSSSSLAFNNNILIQIDPNVTAHSQLLLGSNFVGHDPGTYESGAKPNTYVGYSNYGAGAWNPAEQKPWPATLLLAKNARIQVARFPGGCGTHFYDWKKTIGPLSSRPNYQFGLDEFLSVAEQIGAQPIITVSYFTGTKQDAANLVEYLNAPNDGTNPGGGVDWAKMRALNGYAKPYEVIFFEFGNEVYHGNHRDIEHVHPREYANRFIEYVVEMKKIDPNIKLGAVTLKPFSPEKRAIYKKEWNKMLFSVAGRHIDFLIDHSYFGFDQQKTPMEIGFSRAFQRVKKIEEYYNELRNDFLKATGRKEVLIAVTEFGVNFGKNALEYDDLRYSLGSALIIWDFIAMSMEPSNGVFMSSYWRFQNGPFGMIANGSFNRKKPNDFDLEKKYIKRPSYLVFELLANRFESTLLKTNIGQKNKFGDSETFRSEYGSLSALASRSNDKSKVFLMVRNKSIAEDVDAFVMINAVALKGYCEAYTLNALSIASTNEKNDKNVFISHKSIQIENDQGLRYRFPAHSITLLEFKINK